MNLVCLDTHYFTWAILGRASPGQEEKITKSQEFFQHLDKTDAIIVVPTPIITELLMEADYDERETIITAMESRFDIAEFDIMAAKDAADIWNAKKRAGVIEQIRATGVSMRTKIKIDTQIIAVAKQRKVTMLYSEDKDLRALATGSVLTAQMPEFSVQLELSLTGKA